MSRNFPSGPASQPRRSISFLFCCSLGGLAIEMVVAFERALEPKCDLAAQASHRAPGSRFELFAKRLLEVKAYLDPFCFRHPLPHA